MLAIPALLLGILIAAMSITVISNIFSASANKRIQEFGILKMCWCNRQTDKGKCYL